MTRFAVRSGAILPAEGDVPAVPILYGYVWP